MFECAALQMLRACHLCFRVCISPSKEPICQHLFLQVGPNVSIEVSRGAACFAPCDFACSMAGPQSPLPVTYNISKLASWQAPVSPKGDYGTRGPTCTVLRTDLREQPWSEGPTAQANSNRNSINTCITLSISVSSSVSISISINPVRMQAKLDGAGGGHPLRECRVQHPSLPRRYGSSSPCICQRWSLSGCACCCRASLCNLVWTWYDAGLVLESSPVLSPVSACAQNLESLFTKPT